MLDVKKICTTLYIENNYFCSFYTILCIENNYSCYILNPFLQCECRRYPQRRKQKCQLVTYWRQFITFGFKNLGKEVPTCMPPLQMIM
jgi:hypothetical protein